MSYSHLTLDDQIGLVEQSIRQLEAEAFQARLNARINRAVLRANKGKPSAGPLEAAVAEYETKAANALVGVTELRASLAGLRAQKPASGDEASEDGPIVLDRRQSQTEESDGKELDRQSREA